MSRLLRVSSCTWPVSSACVPWKSSRAGVNRRKLKFTTLNTLQARVSVRIYSESGERGENKSTKKIKRMTRWFVLPRFSSKEPSPRWGGHKDRVTFNPFPLSNDPSDRVSFSSQSLGTQSSHKDHHTIGISCLNYKWVWSQERMRKKAIQAQELKRTQQITLT